MQSVSSRIWTRVAVYISYDNNDYTTGTSINFFSFDAWFNKILWVYSNFISIFQMELNKNGYVLEWHCYNKKLKW